MTGRNLQPGDYATTDFNGPGPMTRVRIVERLDRRACQSGVLFRVDPPLRNGTLDTWYDADWFQPEYAEAST